MKHIIYNISLVVVFGSNYICKIYVFSYYWNKIKKNNRKTHENKKKLKESFAFIITGRYEYYMKYVWTKIFTFYYLLIFVFWFGYILYHIFFIIFFGRYLYRFVPGV